MEENKEVKLKDLLIILQRMSRDCSHQELHNSDIILNKQLRKYFDQGLQVLKQLHQSEERQVSVRKTQEAIMWLGMDLKRLNEPNPYPQSYNASNTNIEPTADGLKL